MTRRVLVLGGTAQARELAERLARDGGYEVVSSLAGRVGEPRLPPGRVRTGGFGGAEGLAAYLAAERIDALVDATHPFAERITGNAVRAAAGTRVPLLVLRRPGWTQGPGDRWHWADDLPQAAAMLPGLGRRAFLTTGRGGLAAFADLDLFFLVRTVDPPHPPLPRHHRLLPARGPFTAEGERALLRRHRIDVLVTKDSGGGATEPKLTAAREVGLPVVVVRRPPPPRGVPLTPDPASALAWLRRAAPPDPHG
ncbi:cobalt-precorrin-6A reductase [Streptomyces sp. HPF1205]|uniref:cobalt-precorrin-6A reductase n=1 Tax=Streptomyces sp. HPF1205 TaxID=2873262 RepID=UPI001CEC2E6E|nr:cobalt-precorrin-6A reductase [Streptomyces sp. HPF1205]